MTALLLLRLAGPLQSWGTSSRFTRRATDRMPSKSGVIGLLAAAQGKRRTDELAELLNLTFAVRIDQAGVVERDFQTATRQGEQTPISVSTRHYLADAVFLAAVEGDAELLGGLHDAVRAPHFPLFLGRRSCPPSGSISLGVRAGSALEVLTREPWAAAPWFQRRQPGRSVRLELVADCASGTAGADLVRDEPLSFDPEHRQWEWRSVRRQFVEIPVPDRHDPLAVL